MEKVILFNDNIESEQEISELLESKGYSTLFAENLTELISRMDKYNCKKCFIYVRNLSDIRLLQTLHSIYEQLEINLIIPPNLREIIELLKTCDFKMLNEITQIV